MTGGELVVYLQRFYGGSWIDKVESFGGIDVAGRYLDSYLNERVNRFSYRVQSISKMFPLIGDRAPSVSQVALILQGKFRQAAGVPDLMTMIDGLRGFSGVVLPLGHPSLYWFKSIVLNEFGGDFLDELRAANDSGRFVQRLKPIYRQVMRKVESGFCHDYPCYVQRELVRLDECRRRGSWFRAPISDVDAVAGREGLRRLRSIVKAGC